MHLKPEELIPAGIALVVAYYVLRAVLRRLRRVKPMQWIGIGVLLVVVAMLAGGL